MSILRAIFFVSLVSLLAALALLALGSVMGYEEFKGGYAVLSADASLPDRTLKSLLEPGGSFFGGSPVCESSQWALLDEFDAVRPIPLDEYSLRVASFDPRNDGYAEKLKDVFIRDGKRFVYIPLKTGNMDSSMLDAHFYSLLGDIPFAVEYYGIGRPLYFFFIVYAAACVCLLVICYVKRKTSPGAAGIVALLPVLSSLAFFGAAGIGAAALLLALFVLLKESFEKLAALQSSSQASGGKLLKLIQKEIILPLGHRLFFLPVFALSFALVVVFSQLKLLFLLAVFAVSCAVFFFSLKTMSLSVVKHRRFTPVLIMKRRLPEFDFSVYMLPLVIASFVTLFFTPHMAVSYAAGGKFDAIVDEQDYYAHLSFQSSFSTHRLGDSSSAYNTFFFDNDGLPSMRVNPGAVSGINVNDFPSFPLKDLMDFFNNVNSGRRTDTGAGTTRLMEIISLLVLPLFVFPGLFAGLKGGSSSKADFDGLKRFSEKLRLKGINRNKTLLYNERNQLRLRKDA